MFAKVRGRLAVSKQAARKFDVGRLNLRWRLGNYQIKFENRFLALENLCDSEDINRV